MKFLMVLKDEGTGEFTMEHVDRLANQIMQNTSEKHQCFVLTNLEPPMLPPLATILPLRGDLPGWWAMMEMYQMIGPAIYMDLDMAILRSLEPLVRRVRLLGPDEILVLRKFRKARLPFQTGITAWSGDQRQISKDFMCEVAGGQFEPWRRVGKLQRAGRLKDRNGRRWDSDEEWLASYLARAGKKALMIQDELPPDYVQSYKRHLNYGVETPTGAIVAFHGTPRPWEVGW
jgi:hypothetical protein